MKKILFLLLCTVHFYGQTSTGQEQSFPYGIVNESLQTITTPTYIGTFGTDGTQGKIPSALIAKTSDIADSLATKENIANKSDSYTTSSSTTYASTKAIVDGLATKQNTLTNPITGTGSNAYLAKFTGTNSQESSALQDTGTSIYAFYSTPFNFTAIPSAAINFGNIGVGGSLIVQTPSLNASYGSGFAVDGTYLSGKSVINISAFGTASGGPYSADMAFKTSTNATLSEKMRLTNTGNLLIGTTVNNGIDKLQVNGSTKTTALTLATAPTTSAGTYEILTRNTSTGVVEKKLNADFIHTSGNETITGTKLFQDTVYMDALEISSIGIDISSGAYFTNLGVTTATAPRSILLPDASGTIALVETVKPYKVYTALLSQSGTSAPTATVLENTLGGTIVWSYNSTGTYIGTLTGAFTSNKTAVFITGSFGGYVTNAASTSVNDVTFTTVKSDTGAYTNGVIANTSIEIRVYN